MQYTISNDCLKVSIDGRSEPELVSKLLLQLSVWELHNSMVNPQEECGIKEAIYADNNIIISDSILQPIIPPQHKKMSAWYKVMCGCEVCISEKYWLLLSWRDSYLSNLNDLSQNPKK